ncbi:hypothetical protein [Propionibacterium acidifaciens]
MFDTTVATCATCRRHVRREQVLGLRPCPVDEAVVLGDLLGTRLLGGEEGGNVVHLDLVDDVEGLVVGRDVE